MLGEGLGAEELKEQPGQGDGTSRLPQREGGTDLCSNHRFLTPRDRALLTAGSLQGAVNFGNYRGAGEHSAQGTTSGSRHYAWT